MLTGHRYGKEGIHGLNGSFCFHGYTSLRCCKAKGLRTQLSWNNINLAALARKGFWVYDLRERLTRNPGNLALARAQWFNKCGFLPTAIPQQSFPQMLLVSSSESELRKVHCRMMDIPLGTKWELCFFPAQYCKWKSHPKPLSPEKLHAQHSECQNFESKFF